MGQIRMKHVIKKNRWNWIVTWDGSYLADKHQASVAIGPLLKLTDAN